MRKSKLRRWCVTVTLWSAWALGLAVLWVQPGPLLAQESGKDTCVFEGTARNAVTHAGIGNVSLRLMGSSIGHAGSTKASGHFRFEGLAEGEYQLFATRAGYSQQWALSDASGHPANLQCTAGEKISGATLWLTPESTLSGKVMGPDGEPLAEARVTLISQKWLRGKRFYSGADLASTDDAGVYRFHAVDAGRYLVYAARPEQGGLAAVIKNAPDAPEMRIASRYYPNAATLESAMATEVKAGEPVTGIDFHLPLALAYHVTGKADVPGEPQSEGVGLKVGHDGQVLDWTVDGAIVADDGSFDIAGVTAGSYELYAFQSRRRERLVSAKVPLSVDGKDVNAFVAPPVKRFDLQGHVRVEGGSPGEIIPIDIFCEGSEGDAYSMLLHRAQPTPEGTFSVSDLPPDRYAIRVVNRETGKDGGFYLKSLLKKGVLQPGKEVDLSAESVDDLELVLSAAVGAVEGKVSWREAPGKDGLLPSSSENTLVILPEKTASGDTQIQTAYLGSEGHFKVSDLEPGKYLLFAVPNCDLGLWQNPEFQRQIASRGAALEITEGTVVRLDLLMMSPTEVKQIESRIE